MPTIDGPETNELVNRATGCIVIDHPVAGIDAVRLRDLKEIVVRKPNREHKAIDLLAGPDADGWIVFVDYDMDAKTHSLKAIRIDGSGEYEVFTRPGDALWDHPMSVPVLAPRGGLVAFLTQPVRPFAPEIVSGPIEVLNIHTKKSHHTAVIALNRSLSWFPDGKRLAYAQPGEPKMVMVLDVESGAVTPLRKGQGAVVSTDGASILVDTDDEGALLVDAKSGAARKVNWPGQWGGPLALIGNDLVLYWALPTKGAKPRVTENNSPFVGPKPMGTLKLADLASGKFQTVVPYIDPRRDVSFGLTGACP